MPRRLAAILVADLVGYSRMMGADEAGTLDRLNILRRAVVDPAIADGAGRIVKSMGDGLLVEFASVVDAVGCAMTVADRMSGDGPDGLRFRFGIHVGDVIEEGGDLFGDAVNIAARIEAEAEPGAIVLSEDAARHARGKVGANLTDIGERRLKNIADPVRLFRVDSGAAPGTSSARSPEVARDRVGRLPTLALAPLRHLGDPAQAYIAEGLSEGLSTALALFNFFELIDGGASDGSQADFILDGSVQVAGPRARITVRLVERATGRRVWGNTYDRSTEDPFTLQDDLVATIACTLGEAIPEEAAHALSSKPQSTWTAYDYCIDGAQKLHRLDPEGCRLGREALETALSIRPGLDRARLLLAWINFLEARWFPDPVASRQAAREIASDLVRQNERDFGGWRLLSRLEAFDGRLEQALIYARRAREINPYESDILVTEGMTLARLGQPREGAALIERALRINPYAPTYYLSELALAQLLDGDPGSALETLRRMVRPVMNSRLIVAAVLVELDRPDEARAEIRAHLDEFPDATVSSASNVLTGPFAERYADLLIRAGLPA